MILVRVFCTMENEGTDVRTWMFLAASVIANDVLGTIAMFAALVSIKLANNSLIRSRSSSTSISHGGRSMAVVPASLT